MVKELSPEDDYKQVQKVAESMMDMLSSEAIDLRDQVQSTGGDFYDASSPASVDSVVQQIEAEQKEDLDSNGKMLETDRPTAALGWTLVGVVSLLGLLAFGRLS